MRIAGMDVDTKSIAIATFENGVFGGTDRYVMKGRRAEDRVEGLFNLLTSNRICYAWNWVYLERPVVGVNRSAVIDQSIVVGMVRYWLWSHGYSHSMVNNSTWKKAVLGSGHASKEEIAAYAQNVLEVPAGLSQDEMDAACIAAFGFGRKESV